MVRVVKPMAPNIVQITIESGLTCLDCQKIPKTSHVKDVVPCRNSSQTAAQATHLATSTKKIGMEFQSASLSAGRLVIHFTPGTTTRDASVTSSARKKNPVHT